MDLKILFLLVLLGNIGSRVGSAPLSTFYFGHYLPQRLPKMDLSVVPVSTMKDAKIPSPATESPKSMKPETTTTYDMELGNVESLRKLGDLLNQYGIGKSEFCLFIIKFMFDSNYLSYRCLPNRLIPMHVGQLYHLIGK